MVETGNNTNASSVVSNEDLGVSRPGLCVGMIQHDGYDSLCDFLEGEFSV